MEHSVGFTHLSRHPWNIFITLLLLSQQPCLYHVPLQELDPVYEAVPPQAFNVALPGAQSSPLCSSWKVRLLEVLFAQVTVQ